MSTVQILRCGKFAFNRGILYLTLRICSVVSQHNRYGVEPHSLKSDVGNRARQLYKNISMLFLFSVKYGKLSTGVNAQRFLSCYG